MGKRKFYEEDEEEYLERKIRRLERIKSKICRRRRRRSYSPVSDRSSVNSNHEPVECDVEDLDPMQEDSQNEESHYDIHVVDGNDDPDIPGVDTGGLRSVVARPASAAPQIQSPRAVGAPPGAGPPAAAPAPEPAPALAPVHTSAVEAVDAIEVLPSPSGIELDAGILSLLGDEPVEEEIFGPSIHKDIATRWSDILINGMKDEIRNNVIKGVDTPDNLRLAQPPLLNPEIKAACSEHVLKRDSILIEKQKLLGTAIAGIASTLSTLLTTQESIEVLKNKLLKSLSNTDRILCHLHFSESQTRRNFLVPSLNKEIKDNIKDLKRDKMLFGKDLQDSLKSIKAISKTGTELKPTATKPKWQSRNQQPGPSTSKALNWRGQPSPAVRPPPRQTAARTSSTRGGRRPPPPARRAGDRRAPPPHERPHHRTSRRY